MDITERVARMRFVYHSNMVSVVNVLNQLNIIPDNKAEEMNKNHTMTIITDILPRLGYDVEKIFEKKESESGTRTLFFFRRR